MCGIVGVLQKNNVVDVAVKALCTLEYRGYDSYGVAALTPAGVQSQKDIGSITAAKTRGLYREFGVDATLAIAHTRWATHGGVTAANAHPHLSPDGQFAVVHNGVIENHFQLREALEARGHTFSSETDTEVIPHLLQIEFETTQDPLAALKRVIALLRGEFAITVLTSHLPEQLLCARRNSPLAYVHSAEGAVVASDQRALLRFTNQIHFLDDGDLLVLGRDVSSTRCMRLDEVSHEWIEVERAPTEVFGRPEDAELGDYPHYMLKEIHEVPNASREIIDGQRDWSTAARALSGRRLILTGSGSAFYVTLIGQYYFSELAGRYAITHPADELSNLVHYTERDHLIAISQSGETYDTLETVRACLDVGAQVTAVNNVDSSTMQRLATFPIFQGSGPEVCVLSTKSVISQCLALLQIARADAEVTYPAEELAALDVALARFPQDVELLIERHARELSELATQHAKIDNWFFIGRGLHYPVAMESALKFKEVSYHHAEGMPAGFFKHGTISLISDKFYTVAFLPDLDQDPQLYHLTASNIAEIRARDGRVIALGHEDPSIVKELGLHGYVQLPKTHKLLAPLLQLIAGQLLAYYCACALGRNIDKPRALAKAVTVR